MNITLTIVSPKRKTSHKNVSVSHSLRKKNTRYLPELESTKMSPSVKNTKHKRKMLVSKIQTENFQYFEKEERTSEGYT